MQNLVKLFTDSFLTKGVDTKNHTVLAQAMFSRNFTANQAIIRYGETGSEFFVLASGSVRVTVYEPGTDPKDQNLAEKILIEKVLEPKGSEQMIGFGEIALLYNDKRTADVTAITDCETWVLSGVVFKQIIAQNQIKRRNVNLQYLEQVQLFDGLDQYDKLKLIDGLKIVNIGPGEYVFHQGDKGDHFYIIDEGQVECGQQNDSDTNFELVRTLGKSEHFGEIALINNVRRTLSVRANSKTGAQLLSLERDTFDRILGTIKQFLKEDYTVVEPST